MFEGFRLDRIDVGEVVLRVRHGGSAPLLAREFTVVSPDLRGYGESTAPPTRPDHAQASKRAMARDVLALMRLLGHDRFAAAGHDRGCYVAFRLALDHPQAVTRLAVLDGVPIVEALERCDARFAAAWWHWFFFAQPEKPERAILADPDAWYGGSEERMGSGEAYADYRAAIHDAADRAAGRRVACPTLVLWAKGDDLPYLYGDVLAVWRAWAPDLRGRGLP